MSIASEITRLQGVKSDILQAIADKGVTIPTGSALDDCPGLIGDIEQGGGGGDTHPMIYESQGGRAIVGKDRIEIKNGRTGSGVNPAIGMQPNLPFISYSDVSTLEINLHVYFTMRSGTNRVDIIQWPYDYTNNTQAFKFLNARYLKYSNELYLSFKEFTNQAGKSDPQILNTESVIQMRYDKSQSKVYLAKVGSWEISVGVSNSVLEGQMLGFSFGNGDWSEGQPFGDGSIIYKQGTNIKLNGSIIWGEE